MEPFVTQTPNGVYHIGINIANHDEQRGLTTLCGINTNYHGYNSFHTVNNVKFDCVECKKVLNLIIKKTILVIK